VSLLLPGMYIAGDSVLHRLDPRMKMAAALFLMTIPFAVHDLAGHLILLACVGAIALLSGAPLLSLLRTLRAILWIGFFLFFFYLFTTPGQPVVSLGGIAITWQGLLAGGVQIYRLGLLVIITSLLTFTTSPAQLAHGLETVLGPLERIGLPIRELAMVLTIALSFVPTFFREIEKISKAQRARGSDFQSGGVWQRIRGLVPVFVPILVSAFRRAEELATAMEARGFRSAPRRTRLYQLRLGPQDLVASLVVLGVGLAALGVGRLL
jgi:energy-coupling factor transport system permease protein